MSCVKRYAGKKDKKKKLGLLLTALGLVIIAGFALFEMYMRPVIQKLLDYKCEVTAERIISSAVFSKLSREPESCTDIVSFTYDNSGRITSLKTDQVRINSLKALLTDAVNEGIGGISGETVGLSLGTLTGISFLYGKGPALRFKIEPKGMAQTKLMSSFQNAGINQTLHSITLCIEAELSPMVPGFYEGVSVTYDIPVAQTVLLGEIPESYSNIILDESNASELADIDIS